MLFNSELHKDCVCMCLRNIIVLGTWQVHVPPWNSILYSLFCQLQLQLYTKKKKIFLHFPSGILPFFLPHYQPEISKKSIKHYFDHTKINHEASLNFFLLEKKFFLLQFSNNFFFSSILLCVGYLRWFFFHGIKNWILFHLTGSFIDWNFPSDREAKKYMMLDIHEKKNLISTIILCYIKVQFVFSEKFFFYVISTWLFPILQNNSHIYILYGITVLQLTHKLIKLIAFYR